MTESDRLMTMLERWQADEDQYAELAAQRRRAGAEHEPQEAAPDVDEDNSPKLR